MQETVYRTIEVLCAVVAGTPVGTNLGLVHLLWMLVSGRLLETRGAVIPGLTATGLPEPAVRRAWAALGQGAWGSQGLLGSWRGRGGAGRRRWGRGPGAVRGCSGAGGSTSSRPACGGRTSMRGIGRWRWT